MGLLCQRCLELLLDIVNFVKRLSSRIVERIKECMVLVRECCCMKPKSFKVRHLYEPVLPNHEKQAAQEFLNHLEAGLGERQLGKETLDALRILAFSENADLQQSAALYYLHMSQHMTAKLPQEFLEPYQALLQSSDLEVQQMSSLSLVNFLLEGYLNKELVVQVGLLEPVLELLESGDSAVQCNSCACIMMLAVSESNREAIGIAGGIRPLLTLAKSYDPRVQQNAVGAILNLTRSEHIKSILCRQGALPVLILLLQSPDSDIQYYSCASLGNIAANADHHEAMMEIGDKFLLRMLVSLMSSSVQKVSSQACLCLNNLASNAEIRTHIHALDIIHLLLILLNSSSKDVRQASITLLCTMTHPPGNMNAVLCKELLTHLVVLMQRERTNPVVVVHAACTIQNLSQSENIEVIIQSQCFEELLQALLDPNNEEETLQYLASCLSELAKHDITRECLIDKKDKGLIRCLVKLAGLVEHKELSFHAASVIKQLSHYGKISAELKFLIKDVQHYLMCFLSHPELRFQQLSIATLCTLSEDTEFSTVISQSQLKEQLEQLRKQTEDTQALLRLTLSQTESADSTK
ncbi:vacuolar protein 8 [Xenopus tropicalis]|uniref:Vacuolar protein 8 n=1 Tax=Xenopus tropicalis TaxID=8364 RepID=A0A803JKZ6_XENTR|nr:vacuolar protein 8 [Xenopus tropicalis]|eukprot:XP_017949765.1 PREDICTED: vacuolar protein 8-like isoform X1 [Xenopus tropicalis]